MSLSSRDPSIQQSTRPFPTSVGRKELRRLAAEEAQDLNMGLRAPRPIQIRLTQTAHVHKPDLKDAERIIELQLLKLRSRTRKVAKVQQPTPEFVSLDKLAVMPLSQNSERVENVVSVPRAAPNIRIGPKAMTALKHIERGGFNDLHYLELAPAFSDQSEE